MGRQLMLSSFFSNVIPMQTTLTLLQSTVVYFCTIISIECFSLCVETFNLYNVDILICIIVTKLSDIDWLSALLVFVNLQFMGQLMVTLHMKNRKFMRMVILCRASPECQFTLLLAQLQLYMFALCLCRHYIKVRFKSWWYAVCFLLFLYHSTNVTVCYRTWGNELRCIAVQAHHPPGQCHQMALTSLSDALWHHVLELVNYNSPVMLSTFESTCVYIVIGALYIMFSDMSLLEIAWKMKGVLPMAWSCLFQLVEHL